MLADSRLIAFVPTVDAELARVFYAETLGLPYAAENGGAMLFEANGTLLRLIEVDGVHPPSHTVVGWVVDDIVSVVGELTARGVEFQDYDFLDDDNPPIWSAPDGTRVAWFRDPDGNVLSVSSSAATAA